MNLIRLRSPYISPAIAHRDAKPAKRGIARVGFDYDPFAKVGADLDFWVVVSTKASRAFADKAQDLKVGDVVRFTAQYGLRSADDASNMISVRGKVVTPRNPVTPDSYGVEAIEVADSYSLDPSVPLPYVGQVFLVAPQSISAVESTAPAESAPAPGTPTYVPPASPSDTTPSPDESKEKMPAPESKTATPPPPAPAGATPLPAPAPANRAGLYVGIGVAIAALLGAGAWYWWPAT